MAKVCISGYYGYESIGNDLVLMSLVDFLRRQGEDMEIVVFSANPAKTREEFDVVAVNRDDWNMVKSELKSADLLISGGGHLLRETSDMEAIKYYLKVIKTALRMKKPVFVFNQVIGPLTSSGTKSMVGKVMQKVQKITVADRESADLLHSLGIRRGRIHVVEDPVLAITEIESEWNLTEIAAPADKPSSRPLPKKKEKKAAPINYDGMEVEIEIHIVEPEAETEAPEQAAAESVVEAETAAPEEVSQPPAETEVTGDTIEIPLGIKAIPDREEEASTDVEAADAVPEASEETPAAMPTLADTVKKALNRPHNLGLVVPSLWKKPGEKFVAFTVSPRTELPVTQITAMADYMIDNGYEVVFLPVNYPDDVTLAKDIIAMMKNKAYEVDAKMSPQSLLTAISEVDFVFSSEIYPMMLAAVCKKPFASLCATGRALDFVKSLGLTPTGSLLEYDGEAFIRNFKAAVANPAVIASAIESNLPELQEKAVYAMGLLQILFDQMGRKKDREERSRNNRSQESLLERRKEQVKSIVGSEQETPPADGAAVAPVNAEAGDDGVEVPAEVLKTAAPTEETPAATENLSAPAERTENQA